MIAPGCSALENYPVNTEYRDEGGWVLVPLYQTL